MHLFISFMYVRRIPLPQTIVCPANTPCSLLMTWGQREIQEAAQHRIYHMNKSNGYSSIAVEGIQVDCDWPDDCGHLFPWSPRSAKWFRTMIGPRGSGTSTVVRLFSGHSQGPKMVDMKVDNPKLQLMSKMEDLQKTQDFQKCLTNILRQTRRHWSIRRLITHSWKTPHFWRLETSRVPHLLLAIASLAAGFAAAQAAIAASQSVATPTVEQGKHGWFIQITVHHSLLHGSWYLVLITYNF